MSRWSLLRASAAGRRETTSESSIHAFTLGFASLLHSKKTIWQGFKTRRRVICLQPELLGEEERATLAQAELDALLHYMESVDCCECTADLCFDEGDVESETWMLQVLIPLGVARGILTHSESSSSSSLKVWAVHTSMVPKLSRADFMRYSVPTSPSSAIDVYTRERPKAMGVSAAGLFSNVIHDGIDNTGNVRVWEAEQALLFYLSHEMTTSSQFLQSFRNKRVLELGGGMTGLCALGLANLCNALGVENVHFTVTDGHPDCVSNQRVCVEMNATMDLRLERAVRPLQSVITSHLLRWSIGDKHGDLAQIKQLRPEATMFDVIVAADCLFFRDFHEDLLWVLDNSLSVNGVVYLLQPSRGGSMELFLSKAAESGIYNIELKNFGDLGVTLLAQQCQEARQRAGFKEDIHLPVLVILSRKARID